MGKVALYVAASIWLVLVVLWPESSDPTGEVDRPEVVGEQLYKTSLTHAPFGLLGVNFFETNEGKKRWNIKSKFAELHRKENYAYLKDVSADFFAEKTGNVVQTKSRYGRSLIDKSLVELEGDVTIHSRRGYLFEMDTLNYDGKSHEFSTEDQVHMKGPSVTHPTMFLRGSGLTGNIDSEHFVIKRNCNAQRQLKNAEWLRINSHAGEFFTEEQRAIFTGKVHSMLPKVIIDSDRFELSVVQEKESLFAKGNVKLHQKGKLGSAEMAFMEIGSNRIVLEGNARIDSKDNEIKGRRIVLYSDEDRVEVESAEGKVAQ